jgi:excisionase family DNA binding protein
MTTLETEKHDLLTIPEASAMLRLKQSTIRDWLLHKRIPRVKLGSRVFLRRSDIESLIAQSLVPSTNLAWDKN